MQQISATDLQSRINEPDFSALLLDVREPNEFEYCHISGSTLIPMQTIPNRVNDLHAWASEVDNAMPTY